MMISPVNDMQSPYFNNVQAGMGRTGGTAAGRSGMPGAEDERRKVMIDGRSFPEDKAKGEKGKYGIEDPQEPEVQGRLRRDGFFQKRTACVSGESGLCSAGP